MELKACGVVPGDYVEQSEHTCPSTCASLAEVGEVLKIAGCDVAVDGELTVVCQSSPNCTGERETPTLHMNRYRCSSETPSATGK